MLTEVVNKLDPTQLFVLLLIVAVGGLGVLALAIGRKTAISFLNGKIKINGDNNG
jgi:hypothetical protein